MSSDMSTSFCIANGIKQGGIISPMLLISRDQDDDLRLLLNCSGIEGYIETSFNNHLCYGDDLCLISLSSSVMPHLINICDNSRLTLIYRCTFSCTYRCTFERCTFSCTFERCTFNCIFTSVAFFPPQQTL